MGDRNNPIKFGPEWLRNLPREQAANRTNNSPNPTSARPTGPARPGGSSSVNSQAASGTSPPTRSGGAAQRIRGSGGNNPGGSGPPGARGTSATASGINTRNSNNNVSRVLLASLRYGREEMLALYDRSAEAPDDLKHFDVLYQPRGKPPAALNNYEDDTRDNGRGGPPAGTSGERFGTSRGLGRGTNEVRLNKIRAPFTRHSPAGRGVSMTGTPRLPMYSGGDEDATTSRAWSASNGAGGLSRTPTEQTDWSKMFRRRQTNNTNWRQQTARDEDEWRQDGPRATNRPNTDKWDRDWGDRPTQDRPQGWNANRRSRVGDQNDDNLPEWAVDNTEGGAGTFDSSGAFHGCSNDDSNLPRSQEPFALTRSHTQGSFAPRKLSIEEGSDEWWASEKAKKLSPRRFDAGDARFKRSQSASANETSSKNDDDQPDTEKNNNEANANSEPSGNKNTYSDTQSFEDQMREEYSDTGEEPGNFQSVMITTNNSLRQKHQNIVSPNMESSRGSTSSQTPEEQIMENFLDIPVDKVAITMSNLQTPASVSDTEISSTTPNPNINIPMLLNTAVPHGMPLNNPKPGPAPIQNIGVTNSALNSSLGLPIGTGSNGIGMPMQGMPSVMQNSQMNSIGTSPIGASMQSRSIIGGFHANNGIPVITGPNAANSLFMNQNNAQTIPSNNELPMTGVPGNAMYPMMGLQHSNSFRSMYGSTMPSIPSTPSNNLAEQWFYEDPNKIIQGPFTSRDMYNWYRAGFFNSSLMVRRGCDAHLRPLGSYGPIVPFVHVDMMSPFSMSGFDSRAPNNHEMLTTQPTLGIEDTLWSQPSTTRDLLWMQAPARNETSVNNLPLYFWDQQPTSAISSNSLLPEDITKEMKTEDQILAQLRASQNMSTTQPVHFLEAQTTTTLVTSDDFANAAQATPDLEELQKLIQNESLLAPAGPEAPVDPLEPEVKDQPNKTTTVGTPTETTKPVAQAQKSAEVKPSKLAKEAEKTAKNKENTVKTKTKKSKEEKREETIEGKSKDEENKVEKRSAEASPTKTKKEEKPTKKELEREKKEWVKEGFTIVKGPEKSVLKESKKKVEEIRAAEEVERKKKEEEKLAAEEDKKRRTLDAVKKQNQEQQQKPLESLIKKAPWSAATHTVSTNKDGLTLAEIQRLEREKKLEQMKEQQHMMHIIAQQQAAAVQREQEMQAVVGWAKRKSGGAGQSLAEIQAETKRQSAAAAAAAAAAQAIEEAQAASAQAVINQLAWGNAHNGGGFWDTPTPPPPKPEKPQEPVKPAEPAKAKKKLAVVTNKKEPSPAVEFEAWCNSVLAAWSYKIDVPTFVGFLKDIESPYEVKDYIKCYLDESKDSNDFARQFLERRSKLLRVGMVTPSDDLCSPAMAINPRNSGSDYQEVKGKGKKTKKNKMLKVDARILGFSVTASEDRINVGDIDTV